MNLNDTLPASYAGRPPPMHPGLRVGLALWAALALLVSLSGVMELLPPFILPMCLGGSALVFLFAHATMRGFRAALRSLAPRPLVLFHLVRVVAGAGFLVLHQRGQLPGEWALTAGWGDIAVGLTAPLAALAFPARTPARWAVALAWSVVGLLDILWVVVNAQRLTLLHGDLTVFTALSRFPLSLLPLFIVPLVFITHGLVLARLLRERPGRAVQG